MLTNRFIVGFPARLSTLQNHLCQIGNWILPEYEKSKFDHPVAGPSSHKTIYERWGIRAVDPNLGIPFAPTRAVTTVWAIEILTG